MEVTSVKNTTLTRGRRNAALSWRNLSVYANKKNAPFKQLVNNVRGEVKSGELTAILGGSGEGKSSLMTALAFRTDPAVVVQGEIRVDGRLVDLAFMRQHSGFMHQEDMFIGTLTVSEHIWFMARMKMDRRLRTRDVRNRIENLLREVGLLSRCNTRIGAGSDDKVLSGGEKKRLAFATEMLTDPSILFLDEPTTGLDAHSASFLISQLQAFASRGRTVLCTIHQPSSALFGSFQRIILVANGRIAYIGSTENAIKFFSDQGHVCPRSYNPADFFVSVLATAPSDESSSKRTAERICDAFLSSDACKELDVALQLELHAESYSWRTDAAMKKDFKPPYCWSRFFWLTHRGVLQVMRDPSVQILRIIQKLCVATIAGFCFLGAIKLDQHGIQAVQGVIFILVSENTFFPMYATLSLIPQELPLFLREYRDGMYPAHLYYLARIASLTPGLIIEPTIFATVIYWLAGLRNTMEAFGSSILVVMFTMNVATACGCFFSAAFDNVPVAMAYLVPFDYILMATMGNFGKLGAFPLYIRWVKFISWLLHSTEALTIIQWQDIRNISCETSNPELPCFTDGAQVLNHYDFAEDHFWTDILLMTIVYFAFHILGYTCLWRKCRTKSPR